MKATEQTILQVERVINKIAQKYPKGDEVSVLTDIHIRVSQDTGEMLAFDDDEQEITRCVVEQWIDSKDENFYTSVAHILQNSLRKLSEMVDGMGILKPYSFVLENDDKDHVAELYLSDDDTIIIGGDLMQNLDKDLDAWMKEILS
ncbi:hypothetical protein J5A66_05290 [Prevotella sp. oral taxon 475]|uniref:hypothetical protein n=1 Tax=Prevotella sp. oral taxon 475 TaxID=712471 RepID=UPI001BA6780E|nr:hypothetical protein [Prevotella sp. oral taxon 475]QUB46423.1 hypothetical protein J5A66_05290 [Prevotella sp. oral taxon 475]